MTTFLLALTATVGWIYAHHYKVMWVDEKKRNEMNQLREMNDGQF